MPSTAADSAAHTASPGDWFATTHWSVVISAGAPDSAASFDAAEQLCRAYWRPVFQFVRRRGYTSHDAQDLTQSFFAKLLEKNFWARADRQKGRFRSFLLNALTQFLADQRDHAHAAKRGGGTPPIPLDAFVAQERIPIAQDISCELLFDRHWAFTVLEHAREALRAECAATGKSALFENLESVGSRTRNSLTYAELASRLDMSPDALKTAVWRISKRYAQLVQQEIAQTVANPSELDEEINYLRSLIL